MGVMDKENGTRVAAWLPAHFLEHIDAMRQWHSRPEYIRRLVEQDMEANKPAKAPKSEQPAKEKPLTSETLAEQIERFSIFKGESMTPKGTPTIEYARSIIMNGGVDKVYEAWARQGFDHEAQ